MRDVKCVQCWESLENGLSDHAIVEEGEIGLVPIHRKCKKNLDVEKIKENLSEAEERRLDDFK